MHPAPYTKDHRFFFPIRVYYEDTDAGGVVYYANYLKFAERARTEWLRTLGISQEAVLREQGVGFVVTRAEIAYKKPARLDDLLWVETHLQEIRKVRMSMRQFIRVDDVLVAELSVDIACVDGSFAPARIEGKLREALTQIL